MTESTSSATARDPTLNEAQGRQSESDVGGHRDAPATDCIIGAEQANDNEVGSRRPDHPADGGEDREDRGGAIAQCTDASLASNLKADPGEEDHHEGIDDEGRKVMDL